MKVNWIKVDLTKAKDKLPEPLNCQSGGYFWIISDGGIYGKRVAPAWWSGNEFVDWNNKSITYFAQMILPDMIDDKSA